MPGGVNWSVCGASPNWTHHHAFLSFYNSHEKLWIRNVNTPMRAGYEGKEKNIRMSDEFGVAATN